MKLYQKVLSAVMSFALAGVSVISAAVPTAYAEDTADVNLYDSIIPDESKESPEESSQTETTETTVSGEVQTTASVSREEQEATTTTTTIAVTEVTAETEPVTQTTTEVPFNVFNIYNAHRSYIASATTTTATEQTTETTTTVTEPTQTDIPLSAALAQRQASGIDVSSWQPNIDWAKVKADGIEFAICRAGYGKYAFQKDSTFDYNIKNAQANGIDVGVYWYSYATTVEDAYKEAEVCYEIIRNYNYTYPVYFDIEDSSQSNLSAATISAIIDAFCSTIQSKGYKAGVYSYVNFLNTKVYQSILDKYEVWIANFDVATPSYTRDYGMWQYTARGGISGINGDVDLDIAYVNYPYIISPETYVDTPATTFNRTAKIKTTTTTTAAAVNKGIAHGIDVSSWQGDINWQSVKNTNDVDFAIIRAGYGKYLFQEDAKFDYNIKTAQSLGIACGVYWYSYATTVEDAKQEAEVCYEIIKDYKLEYPVYFDVEDSSIASLGQAQISAITDAFCSAMESKGYFVGITSYSNFLKSNLTSAIFEKYAVWVAHYGVTQPSYTGSYGIWQYTNTGSVSGISGNVDRNYAYVDYPSIMKQYHLNGF